MKGPYAKAIYAAILAALTSAAAIFVANPILIIALAAFTALGVLFVPAPGYVAGSWDGEKPVEPGNENGNLMI